MSYFARIAARASARAVRETSSAALPAMLSRSPLVEHDQRLALPGFAERALLSGQTPSSAPSPDLGAETAPATGAPVPVARKASASSFMPVAAALGLGAEGAREPASSSAGFPARAAESPLPANAQPWSAAETPRAVAFEPSALAPAAPPGELHSSRPSQTARALPGPLPSPEAPAELAPPARSIFEALTRADAWTRSAPRAPSATPASSAKHSAEVAPAPLPQSPAIAPASYAEAPEATIGLPGAPMVSIGRLEIEVVAPPRAEPTSAPRKLERSQRTAARAPAPASFSAPRAYGWRQR
jgi:hypothetical protein